MNYTTMHQALSLWTMAQVEGTCNGRYGYIIAINKIVSVSKGMIRTDGTGFATFKVDYMAVVCRPYKGEVVDCVVTSVNNMGFFAEAGPLQIFVSNHLIPEEYQVREHTRGK